MTIAPPNLSSPTTSAQKQIVTRAGTVSITNPDGGVPVVVFNVEQKLWLDGVPVMPLPLDNPANPGISQVARSMTPDVAAKTTTVTDPVTGNDVTISLAGVAAVMTQVFADWYAADLAALTPPPAS